MNSWDDTSAPFSRENIPGCDQFVHTPLTWGLDREGLVVREDVHAHGFTLCPVPTPCPRRSESHTRCACGGYLLAFLAAQL